MVQKNKKLTILLAEDDAPVRNLISRNLKMHEFNVIEAEDGKQACLIYEDKNLSIDAIVSDLRMPKVSGEELAKYNYENRFLPFVVCTSLADVRLSLNLLEFGVKDYIVKPLETQNFIRSVKNAINRRMLRKYIEDDSNPYAGNVGEITIPSKLIDLQRASNWIEEQVKSHIDEKECGRFINYLGEFLLNAHEHGNLKIGENEKSRLIEEGRFEEEMEFREIDCKAKINICLSVLKNEVAVKITDDGYGFDYNKYMNMTEDALLERLTMPNGRGIQMATRYFDSIKYSKGGASALIVKEYGSSPVSI